MPKKKKPRTVDVSPALLRKLERMVKDIEDPRRYVIIPSVAPWESFYNISTDAWAADIERATLFKRRKIALAVARLLRTPSRIEEVQYKRGKPIVRSRKPAGPRSRTTNPGVQKRRRIPRSTKE
jgi:predicted transcriptional regulator